MLTGTGKRILSLLVLLFTLPLAACTGESGGAKSENAYYTFTDAANRQIVLSQKPARVAVLFSSFAEVWQTAGGEVAVTVGESAERGFVSQDVPQVDGGAGKTIDTERLISYQPDFVIASADIAAQAEAASVLNNAGIPAALFHVECFADYCAMMKICTDITENNAAYETYVNAVQTQIDEVLQNAAAAQSNPKDRILFVRAGSTAGATKAKTAADNFVCTMLNELGTENIAEDAPVLLDGLSIEAVIEEDPSHIFISTMGDEAAAKAYMDSVLQTDAWQALSAVQEGKVHYLPKDMFQFKPNARWGEAYAYLYNILYTGLS